MLLRALPMPGRDRLHEVGGRRSGSGHRGLQVVSITASHKTERRRARDADNFPVILSRRRPRPVRSTTPASS